MKINEFVEMMNHARFARMDDAKKRDEITRILEIKPYLPIAQKREMVDKIMNYSLEISNGMYKIDGIKKYIATIMQMVQEYTNLEIDIANFDDDYDVLAGTGLLYSLMTVLESEYKMVLSMVDLQSDYILADNSVEAQVARFTNALNEKFNISLAEIIKSFA